MSQGNVAYELQYGIPFPRPTSTVIPVVRVPDATNVYPNTAVAIIAYVHSSVPATQAAEAGKYAYGCRLINTKPTYSATLWNAGTVSVPSWSALS